MARLFRNLFQQDNTGSRSTVMNPIGWMLATLSTLLLGAIQTGASEWIQQTLLAVVCVVAAFYLVAFAFFAWTSPDSLRSEKFSITKLAIEHGLKGDNLFGLVEPDADSEALPPKRLEGGSE